MKIKLEHILPFIAIIIGGICGVLNIKFLSNAAESIITLFMTFLKFLSLPLIFVSITSAFSGPNTSTAKSLILKVIKYTLLTTFISCFVGFCIFMIFFPSKIDINTTLSSITFGPIIEYFINTFPKDIFSPFVTHNPLAIAIASIVIGIGTMGLQEKFKSGVHNFCIIFMDILLNCTKIIKKTSFLTFWAFGLSAVKSFIVDSSASFEVIQCVFCIAIANFTHAFICIPIFLKIKGISPINVAKKSFSALIFAFFSKSSSATLPLAMEACEKKLNVDSKISKTVLPMCSIINMNACAAFILISSMFVMTSNGNILNISAILVLFIVSITSAIGNSGVPMGCYFMSYTYLVSANQDISIMKVILSYYVILDMVETATNIWSDIGICNVVNKEIQSQVRS